MLQYKLIVKVITKNFLSRAGVSLIRGKVFMEIEKRRKEMTQDSLKSHCLFPEAKVFHKGTPQRPFRICPNPLHDILKV